MSHRPKHRFAAAAGRTVRRDAGSAVDPSNRATRKNRGYWCPGCGEPFRTVTATRMHFLLKHVTAN